MEEELGRYGYCRSRTWEQFESSGDGGDILVVFRR